MTKLDRTKENTPVGDNQPRYNQLTDPQSACDYIDHAFKCYEKDQDSQQLLLALKNVVDARGGLGWLAKQSQLNREHLYRMLSKRGNPRLSTLNLIMRVLDIRLSVVLSTK